MKKILILGDGIIGHLVALTLTKFGHKIYILKSESVKASNDNRYFSLNLLSKYFLSSLKTWPSKKNSISYKKIKTWDEETQKKLYFDCSDISFDCLGYVIKETDLIDSIAKRINENKNIVHITKVEKLSEDGTCSIYDNKKNIKIDHVIFTSRNHKLLPNKIKIDEINYNQEAIITNVKLNGSEDFTAYQKFSKSCIQGLLPTKKNSYNLIMSADFEKINHLKNQSKNEFLKSVRAGLDSDLFSVESVSSFSSFPLSGYKIREYYNNNMLYIGGAAHSVHPLAGMGLNMGIQEVFIIFKMLEDFDGQIDDKLFASCDFEFRKYNNELYYGINFLKEFYTGGKIPMLAKKLSLHLFDSLKILKSRTISKATGVSILKSFNVLG